MRDIHVWSDSSAEELWIFCSTHDQELEAQLRDFFSALDLGVSNAMTYGFFHEWDEIWEKAEGSEEALPQLRRWLAEKQSKLDYYRTLRALEGERR